MKTYGSEAERMNFYTESCDVLFFEFSSKMPLDERGLKAMLVTTCADRISQEKPG